MSLLSRTPRTVLGALVPGVLDPWVATRIAYVVRPSIGNSATDLSGGHAERTFKLPDYDGQLS